MSRRGIVAKFKTQYLANIPAEWVGSNMRNEAEERAPSAELASAIAAQVTGCSPETVSRFTTGAQHYVYEAKFAGREPVVVRIGRTTAHSEMTGAVYLSRLLRPRGVPLPAILAEDVQSNFPWLVLERLPGTDLGAWIGNFTDSQLDRIAATVAQAQSITSETGSAGRYGYAVTPEEAPHSAWSQVLDAHLARSQRRIASAGLFDIAFADVVQSELSRMRDDIDAIPPRPFLHDTTMKNVIVTTEGSVSGIVDVDDLCFGDPRYAAALTLAVLTVQRGPLQYVSAWLRHAGLSDDRLFRLYVTLFLLDLMAEHGQVFNGNQRPSSPQARAELEQSFNGSLRFARA
ncbi:aminoglycoside phosphotransferase family protein [Bradyrhizobium sp.]|uniref:aminoglycoside phosphotransferase family protein n=1 Tax=Bradyrhizobium sp. TaxID=376 RepID=UPI003C4D69D0